MPMRDILDLTGASGQVYRFQLCRESEQLMPVGGNFVLVRDGIDGPRVVYAGESNDLRDGSASKWRQAQDEAGPTWLYTRLNVSERTRQLEQADVEAAYTPPMNDPTAAH
jgi:hypothetical protein